LGFLAYTSCGVQGSLNTLNQKELNPVVRWAALIYYIRRANTNISLTVCRVVLTHQHFM